MRILMGVQRIVSVRAVALPKLIDKKRCERERFTMITCAAAQCCRLGALLSVYMDNEVHLLARARPNSCLFTW